MPVTVSMTQRVSLVSRNVTVSPVAPFHAPALPARPWASETWALPGPWHASQDTSISDQVVA